MKDMKICPKTRETCTNTCQEEEDRCSKVFEEIPDVSLCLTLADGSRWFRVKSIKEVYEVFELVEDNTKYMILAGFTSHGVYRIKDPMDIYIDVNSVNELHDYRIDSSSGKLILGANMTLSNVIKVFKKLALEKPKQFAHLKGMADHIDLVANVPVRNTGTIAGNLSIKYNHHEFPSDIFLLLEAVNAMLTIGHVSGIVNDYPLQSYLELDMRQKLITNISIPSYDSSYAFRSYKLTAGIIEGWKKKLVDRAMNDLLHCAQSLVKTGFL